MENTDTLGFRRGGLEDIIGTSLMGRFECSYQDLVTVFGEPDPGSDDHKTDVEWVLVFTDGTVAAVYNWKDGPAYCGPDGTPVEGITEWNVGGSGYEAVEAVLDLLSRAGVEAS